MRASTTTTTTPLVLSVLAVALYAVRVRHLRTPARRGVGLDDDFRDAHFALVARFLALPQLVSLRAVSRRFRRLADASLSALGSFDDVANGVKATDAFLHALAARCPRLRRLSVCSHSRISDAGLSAFTRHGDLCSVSLSNQAAVTDEGLQLVVDSRTTSLALSNLRRVTERGLAGVAAGRMRELVLERLRLLNLEALQPVLFTASLASLALQSFTRVDTAALLKDCSGLHTLNLSSSTFVQGNLVLSADTTSLRVFAANYALDLTDADVERVLEANRGLRAVSLNGAEFISDATLDAIAHYVGATVEHVNVSQTCVSAAGLVAMAVRCPLLRALFFGGTLVDDAGLEQLAGTAPQLRELGCSRCPLVTRGGLARALGSGGFPLLERLWTTAAGGDAPWQLRAGVRVVGAWAL